jgi:uncharacterized protein (TIGR03000 family)
MSCLLFLPGTFAVVAAALPAVPAPPPAVQEPAPTDDTAHVTVIVAPHAELWFNSTKVAGVGSRRQFYSPVLTPGQDYLYEVHARWTQGDYPVDRTHGPRPGELLARSGYDPRAAGRRYQGPLKV